MVTALVVAPATVADLDALAAGSSSVRGWRVEPGYLEFPEALVGSLATLVRGVPASWSTHLFVFDAVLIGLGGYKGPPTDGAVEIGYGIAPAYRGRGLATAAARELTGRALERGVRLVRAHTLAAENPSTGVLVRLGFVRVAEVDDPEDGPLWRWEYAARPAPA